jgi:hypothetical protein
VPRDNNNEISESIKDSNLVDQLNNYQLLKRNSATGSRLISYVKFDVDGI